MAKTSIFLNLARFITSSVSGDGVQELLLPFSIAAVNLDKLKRWENPGATVTFLFFVYGVIYMYSHRYLPFWDPLFFSESFIKCDHLSSEGTF